jgi:hypothetical protein
MAYAVRPLEEDDRGMNITFAELVSKCEHHLPLNKAMLTLQASRVPSERRHIFAGNSN